jgi:hypothetical protein
MGLAAIGAHLFCPGPAAEGSGNHRRQPDPQRVFGLFKERVGAHEEVADLALCFSPSNATYIHHPTPDFGCADRFLVENVRTSDDMLSK